ncbi:MAG: AmmeMemoRadiSam system protein B [Candidatus Aminicenantes bacterium]|nr:AmmeMemoRadiSam system protein B [Candidatus Aminicenantes bacterium]
MKRAAAVAGSFYPGNAAELRRMIGLLVDPNREKVKARAVVCPHAGYIYSGAVAAAVYSSVELPETFVILAPAHRPQRPAFAIMTEGQWETPLGTVPVASPLAAAIQTKCPLMIVDPASHAPEHSLEVQIPFLQYFLKDISIVPINVSARAVFSQLREAGEAIAGAIRESGEDVLLVASTDMSHYISAARAKGLVETVMENDISMCGVLPTAAVMVAAQALGATRAELVAYTNSGEITGDDREVVAYAGLRLL